MGHFGRRTTRKETTWGDLGLYEKVAFKVGLETGLRKLSVWQVGDTGFGFLLAI